jgi:predicted dehydrogenase
LAADLTEAVQLVRLAERTGAILQVGHIERFNPAFQAAAKLCDKPRYIRAERLSPFSFRSTDIGVVHDMMIHDLDLVLSLACSPVVRVEAFGLTLMGQHEDAVQARLTFESGCVADLSASRVHPTTHRTATIWTATRCLAIDFGAREVTSYAPSARLKFGTSPVERSRQPGADIEQLKQEVFGSLIEVQKETLPAHDALTAEISEFVECVRSGTSPTVTGTVAVEVLAVAERVLGALAVQSPILESVPSRHDQRKAA